MKILTIDGGGVLGLIPLTILAEYEKAIGKPLYQVFDMIAGVSTGSIIAAGISKGMSAEDLKQLYLKEIPTIFGKPKPSWMIWWPKYDANVLESMCIKYFNFDLKDSKNLFMLSSVRISEQGIAPKFWKSWKDNLKAYDCIIASCSAPTYFKPRTIGNEVFCDGGVAANDISTCALVEAIRMTGSMDHQILNLGTHTAPGFKKAAKMNSVIEWATNFSTVALECSNPLAEYQCTQLIKDKYHTVKPVIDLPMDTLNFDALIKEGLRLWELEKDYLINNIK